MRFPANRSNLPKIGKPDGKSVLLLFGLGQVPQAYAVSGAEIEEPARIFSPKEHFQISA
jgi:hypothetical protein